ncbi:glycoside hydrolase 5 family protein [Abyssalbus ytuae]|uniref:mannan endo-1,4-beta-mannosidase n=1 Tax=Abyssalbus ytuae TaxID=2926907 RepID=A0A9E6ZQ10_9FLAO|nr:cellulase family glycosylhydrolase [Abyssalbus ytuae]UOB18814.1 cellulase family glycosylhydrolase [Abyssalbus ytuae]
MKSFVPLVLVILSTVISCKNSSANKGALTQLKDTLKEPELITVKGNQFYKGSKPYYFVGANYWYGPLLAAKDSAGKERLKKELDLLKSYGIDNLRVLVGAEGGTNDYTVRPALQYEQGKYNEALLNGLDYFMAQMRKRNMYAVLYMNNNWEWSGGMAQYLSWNGYGNVPIPNLPGYTWPQYMEYTEQFHSCEPCMEAFRNHIKFIMGRTNKYTGIKYTDDNTVMSWQVANEPRVFSQKHEAAFTKWLNETVNLIDSLDSKHLVSTGGEGAAGYLWDINLFERTHTNPKIDYLTMHMWPYNWGWYKEGEEGKLLEDATVKAKEYIANHTQLAAKMNKPIVMSEFGLPRAQERLFPDSDTRNRDTFYSSLFSLLTESYTHKNSLAGYNFWGFGGYGKSAGRPEGKWQPGDDFMADPPQEPQGFNNVFATDTSTLKMIKEYNIQVGNM